MKSGSIVKRFCQFVYDFHKDNDFNISLISSVIVHMIIQFMKYTILLNSESGVTCYSVLRHHER
jgi:hypothetical protein